MTGVRAVSDWELAAIRRARLAPSGGEPARVIASAHGVSERTIRRYRAPERRKLPGCCQGCGVAVWWYAGAWRSAGGYRHRCVREAVA